MGRTLQCPICGEPYKFYSYSAADQSACRDCVRKTEAKMRNKNISFVDIRRESQKNTSASNI